MSKPRQPLLPTFTMERIVVRKIIPHTRRRIVLRFRMRTQVQYHVRWNQMVEVKKDGREKPPDHRHMVINDKE